MLRYIASFITPTLIKKCLKKERLRFYTKKNLNKANKKLKTGVPVNVVFLVNYPEMWNSEKSVYLELKKNAKFNPIIVCLPKLINNNNGIGVYAEFNDAYAFFSELGINAINAKTKDGWVNLQSLDPDFVFYQKPYLAELPKEYWFSEMIKQALLCYIPYGFCLSKRFHLKLSYNDSFLNNIQLFFSDSHYVYNYYLANRICNYNKVFDFGHPRFDLITTNNSDDGKTVLWTPRWYFGDGDNNKSSFLVYLDTLISFFQNNKQFRLIIRPHPLMFGQLVKSGVLSVDELESIKERVVAEPNISIDYEKDYLISFAKSSILISDFSSLLAEYFVTGKPILYCGEYDDLNEMGLLISKTFYDIKSANTLVTTLKKVLSGDDKKAMLRNLTIEGITQGNEKVSKKIVNTLLNEMKRR